MRSLTYVQPGVVEWREAGEPRLEGDGEALIRPLAASTCEIDQQIIRGRTRLPGPFALGHECIAEVVDVGDAVAGIEPGQLCVVPWHICCGECARCRAGMTCHCEAVPRGAMYGMAVAGHWGGLFDDLVRVPYAAAMVYPVPPGLDLASIVSASGHPNLAVEVLDQHLRERPAARVLVLGARSTGVYAVDVAVALGAAEVVYADTNPDRVELARRLGARAVDGMPQPELGEFDVVIDARYEADWLRAAVLMLTPEGICEVVGPYLEEVPLPLYEMYLRGVRLRANRGNVGVYIPRLLELVQAGRLHTEQMVSATLPWDDAAEAVVEPDLKPMFVRDPAT